jgi:hypothetical protein
MPMENSTRNEKNGKAKVVKMNVGQFLPRQEILDYICSFARSYKPVAI